MDKAIAWGISLICVFVVWLVVRSRSNGRTGSGTGSDLDRVRDNLKGAGDDNQRLAETEQRTADRLQEQADTIRRAKDENRRSQQLVEKAQNLLRSAKHTNSDN